MTMIQRIIRADDSRISRLHDAKGGLHIDANLARSCVSTFARHAFKVYPKLPWLTYGAISRLRTLTPGKTVFEFGAGSSTEWFARHAREVVSIENNRDWFTIVKNQLARYQNVELLPAKSEADFLDALGNRKPFDIYLIDCQAAPHYGRTTEQLRMACLEAAAAHGHRGSIFIVDNTDANPELDARLPALFAGRQLERFAGWVPGILHPNETTIVHGDENG